MRYYEDNGWGQFCDEVNVILAQGDHDSILRPENLALYSNMLSDVLQGMIHTE